MASLVVCMPVTEQMIVIQLGGNVSFFKNNRRISVVGLLNNINQQNFGTQDLLGVTSSGGGDRGGGGADQEAEVADVVVEELGRRPGKFYGRSAKLASAKQMPSALITPINGAKK